MTTPGSYRRKKGLSIFPPVVAVSTMLPALLAAGALGLAAVEVAAPVSASYGGCYKDIYGNCSYAPFSLATKNNSPADMDAWGTTPDQHFAYFVTHDDHFPGFRIMDFPTLKAQVLRACQQETNGMDIITASDQLAAEGGYTASQADSIMSAAETIYCPWNNAPPRPW
jgi:hypothetical protein